MNRQEGLRRAIESVGGINALARLIGVTAPAVAQWKRVPTDRVVSVEIATGVPREELRPDIYRRSQRTWNVYERESRAGGTDAAGDLGRYETKKRR